MANHEENTIEKVKFREVLSTIWWVVRLNFSLVRGNFIVTVLTNLLISIWPIVLNYIYALLLQEIIDILASDHHAFTPRLIILFVLSNLGFVMRTIFSQLDSFFTLKLRYRYDQVLRTTLLERIAKLDIEYLEDSGFQKRRQRATEAVDWRVREMSLSLIKVFSGVATLILTIGILLTINWIFLFLLIIPVIADFLVNKKFGQAIYGIYDYKGEDRLQANYASESLSNLGVLSEAKIYGFAGYVINKYKKAYDSFISEITKKMNRKIIFSIMSNFLDIGIFTGIEFWILNKVVAGEISVGNYSFYMNSLSTFSANLYGVQYSFAVAIEYSQYAYDLKMIAEAKDRVIKPINGIKVENKPPRIEFKNVSFKYPNKDTYILKNLSFVVDSGEKVSLVGENGAGKSTIIKLLARFYDVTEGEILINGTNIKDIDLDSYYKLWGVLFQSFASYWFSPKENIGIGNLEAEFNEDMVIEASKKAGSHNFIEKLPKQYNNMLQPEFDQGTQLSGGQWQRIAIARGLFANPKVVILDEPTSALDALAEAKIFEEIEKLASNSTMLIVSHRFATVRNADKILVIENGEISEQGSHNELIENHALYYKMFTEQAKGYS